MDETTSLHDILEIIALRGGHTHTVNVKRGTLEVGPGHLSYVEYGEDSGRTYVALHTLERWRYYNRQGN